MKPSGTRWKREGNPSSGKDVKVDNSFNGSANSQTQGRNKPGNTTRTGSSGNQSAKPAGRSGNWISQSSPPRQSLSTSSSSFSSSLSPSSSSSSANISADRKELNMCIGELRDIQSSLQRVLDSDPDAFQNIQQNTQNTKKPRLPSHGALEAMSLALTRLGTVQFSTSSSISSSSSSSSSRGSSLALEIQSVASIISRLPQALLSTQDMACISRFITRASKERKLHLGVTEARGLYRLLIGFIKSEGKAGRKDAGNARDNGEKGEKGDKNEIKPLSNSGNIIDTRGSIGLLVVHEVMRGLAQLVQSCGEQLQAHRINLLTSLLAYCDSTARDMEVVYAAVDAVGNILIHPLTHAALEQDEKEWDSRDEEEEEQIIKKYNATFSHLSSTSSSASSSSSSLTSSSCAPKDQRVERALRLWKVHEACNAMLIENLRFCLSTLDKGGSIASQVCHISSLISSLYSLLITLQSCLML